MVELSRREFLKISSAALSATLLPHLDFPGVSAVQIPPLGKIDPFTGELKSPDREALIFFGGFMTDEGIPYNEIVPIKDTFTDLRQKLKTYGWNATDSFFFTYGVRGIDRYKATDTARSPREIIKHTVEFFETIEQMFPLVQFHLFAHSLGGIFALEVAKRYSGKVKSLSFINSPVKGIEPTIGMRLRTGLLTQAVRPWIGEEKVTGYLFDLWNNREYQEGLVEFARNFTESGRKLVTVISKDDPIVPKESSSIPGSDEILLSLGSVGFNLFLLDYLRDCLDAHGRPLRNDKAIEEIIKKAKLT